MMDAPVLVENPIVLNVTPNHNDANNNTGFPFDDSDFDERDRNRSFRSTLDDIAKRHPEFAEHLNFDRFPFRSNTLGHKRRGSGDQNRSNRFDEFTDCFGRPSSSRFKEKFGFPFSETEPEQPPQADTETKQKVEETKPPQVPKERGRKANPNIPQSSTVDLGQKQDPVCDIRGQRSMSAPPENRAGQRFVSSINIPINIDGNTNDQQQQRQQPQQQQQSKSNERVIPIHVEGRDEPVIPKNVNQTFTQPPPPQSEKVFGQNRPGFGTWKRDEPPYYTGESKFFNKDPNFFTDPNFDDTFAQERPNEQFSNTGAFKQDPQRTPPPTQQKAATPPPKQQKAATPPPKQQQQPPPPQPVKLGPIEQIQCIQKDVLELMSHVEKFNGRPKDRQYLYLDEMLTRNLLKLDDVETEGKENIRHARKEAINCIQKCISILEAKAMANEQLRSQVMDVDTKLEVPPAEGELQLTSLEVSGVSRSGSENISNKEMEQEAEAVPEPTPVENMETEVKGIQEESTIVTESSEIAPEKNEESKDSSQTEPNKKTEETKDKKKVKKKEKVEK